MRSRTLREGSVGLLILVGIGLFGAIILWLTGAKFGNRSYSFIVEFTNINGMKVGSSVVYRGVAVGRITSIRPSSNGVEVTLEISQSNLPISKDSLIEVNQSGLIGESSVAITPKSDLPKEALNFDPLASDCNQEIIICNGSRVNGDVGVSFNQLLRGTFRVSNLYSSPEFFENINTLAKNASEAAAGVAKLTKEFSAVTGDLKGFTANASNLTASANRTVVQIGDAATITTAAAAQTALQIGDTADQYRLAGAQLNQLLANFDSLVSENRGSLVSTLNNLSQTSSELRTTVVELRPAISQLSSGQLLQNLETLSANAAEASRNLRDVSSAVNNPSTLAVLQQTLDSARATFENVQKITADLDDLTGDPQFRNNLRQLINGLGNLVSSSQQLQQQVQVANQLQQLAPSSLPPLPPPNSEAVPIPDFSGTVGSTLRTAPRPQGYGINPSNPISPPQLANNYQIRPRLGESQVKLEELR